MLSTMRCLRSGRVASGYATRSLATSRSRGAPAEELAGPTSIRFSHVHMYADKLRPTEEYKKLESKLTEFSHSTDNWGFDGSGADVEAGRKKWLALESSHGNPVTGATDPKDFTSNDQDVVEQMLVGANWRIKGVHKGANTHSVVVSSPDPTGVCMVVTAHPEHKIDELVDKAGGVSGEDALNHFDASHLARYARSHKRQGISSLGFTVGKGDLDKINARYSKLHPKLLLPDTPRQYGDTRILEVYAYYEGDKSVSAADIGTVLRFVESADGSDNWVLPGVEKVDASYSKCAVPLYFDHWVSNVNSRTGFLDTLYESLGFTPKVDFNAGVVAAGEAQIESTVAGNTLNFSTTDKETALRNQNQIYLPINNALTEVGHVSLFLNQLGQGVQHIAQRVEDLPTFIQRANDYRKMTGAGLSFLNIPPSYYGYLTPKRLVRDAGCAEAVADECVAALRKAGIVDERNIVDIDVTREKLVATLPNGTADTVVDAVLRGRYNNLYDLLKDHLSADAYLRVVRNKVLVDIQGEDVLMQIFSGQILQRRVGEEAPFLEFIQRICSECLDEKGQPRPIRPGCGGFGIRNFLTLFLSIEVNASSEARAAAVTAGDTKAVEFHTRMVDTFIAQLDESNPILTTISDAMTAEGLAREAGNEAEAERYAALKEQGNQDLMVASTKYSTMVKGFRTEFAR